MTVEHLNGHNLLRKHAQDIETSWQVRLMRETRGHAAAVVMVVMAHNFYEILDTLCRVAFPGFQKMALPCLSGPAKIAKSGQVYCTMVKGTGGQVPNCVIFESETEMRDEFRRFADELKFNDKDREEMFRALQNWIVVDYRVNELAEKTA